MTLSWDLWGAAIHWPLSSLGERPFFLSADKWAPLSRAWGSQRAVQRWTGSTPLPAMGQWSCWLYDGASRAAGMFCRENTRENPFSGPQELGGDYARHFILHLADWLCGSFLLMDSFSAQESGVHVFLLAWLGSRADLVLGHHCVWCCPPVHRCIFTNSASKFLYLP